MPISTLLITLCCRSKIQRQECFNQIPEEQKQVEQKQVEQKQETYNVELDGLQVQAVGMMEIHSQLTQQRVRRKEDKSSHEWL